MPKTSRSRSFGLVFDINSTSIAELTPLPAQVLRLHLSSWHLITASKRATLACRLHKALHLIVPAMMADSASNVTVLPPTSTSFNSSMPPIETVTYIDNQLTQHHQFATNLTTAVLLTHAAIFNSTTLQPNLSLVSDCDNSNIPTSMLPQSFNAAAPTFTQVSANCTSATNAPLYQVAGQPPTVPTYQLLVISTSVMPLQLQNR